MAQKRYFEDVEVGDEIGPVIENCSEVQLFFFSAATNNGHRIHYDLPYAKTEGHPTILVHGPLQTALMAKTVLDWAGPGARLVRIQLQNRGSAYPHEDLYFGGVVTDKRQESGRALVDCDLYERKADGTVIMPGTATVSLPRR
ncbi:MAG TPA: acyl dehydratase [Dehalococcoidia bacterium]|nr:acyl dehydratase [Dehalococcoidia bacterium]